MFIRATETNVAVLVPIFVRGFNQAPLSLRISSPYGWPLTLNHTHNCSMSTGLRVFWTIIWSYSIRLIALIGWAGISGVSTDCFRNGREGSWKLISGTKQIVRMLFERGSVQLLDDCGQAKLYDFLKVCSNMSIGVMRYRLIQRERVGVRLGLPAQL